MGGDEVLWEGIFSIVEGLVLKLMTKESIERVCDIIFN